MKVTIENKGSASLSIKGRHGFHIDAHSSIVVELPDTPGSANMLQRLRREYPAMRVLVEKGEPLPRTDAKGNAASSPGVNDAAHAPSAPASPSGSPAGGADGGADVMSAENFASRAKVTKGEAGWWTVTVEGIRDIKVRSAKSEEAAIEMAYAEYIQGRDAGE